MRRLPIVHPLPVLAGVLAFALAACADHAAPVVVRGGTPLVVASAAAPNITRVDTLLRGLEVPWGVVELRDGGLFVAERPGRIRFRAAGADSAEVWATLDVYSVDPGIGPEAGLMGIALDPDTSDGTALFVLATTWRSGGDRDQALVTRLQRRLAGLRSPLGALRHKNQVLRLSHDATGTLRREVIVDDLPTTYYHAGGSISVGPDGNLYVGVGDAMLPQLARHPRAPLGKLLRYTRDGRIPADNPDPTSPVFVRGLRNTQALAWLRDGTLLGADHGPSGMAHEGGLQGRDEFNILTAGGDYGWPDVTGWDVADGITTPTWLWDAPIAPAGMAVRTGDGADSARVLVGGLRGHLEQLTMARTADGWHVVTRALLTQLDVGRLRSVVSARDGSVLVTTSNRDARGVARPGDDLVLRLTLDP